MKDFFSTEGKFYKVAGVLGDIFLVGALWTIFVLPIVTIGATTTAAYYICTKKVSGKDGYIFREFCRTFKENFIKASLALLILVLCFYVVWLNLNILPMIDFGGFSVVIYAALYFVLIQTVFVVMYVFPLISRFELSIFGALKSAFLMANRHLFTTLTNLALIIALVFVSMLLPVLIIFTMGFYIYLSSFLFVKVFRKHYPNFDESEEISM